ncbi:hypothetical protein BVX93_01580 [bacterium B13(2017)]|nr:hypothetical protein BVX93_01580 [bacterium B13(2017)]
MKRKSITLKDMHTEPPRWCVGCGNINILNSLKRFIVLKQLDPAKIVSLSGIGCSGRTPNHINTYGVHAIHGRAIPVALGLSMTRPELHLFIHSGDGDALSIGGNHLIHGINKNFNCVFLLHDNELYALTKCQTSPTTKFGKKTNTQPKGTPFKPVNAVGLALGFGASFVASTADWMRNHFDETLEAAFNHKGFSFVHVAQRCPHHDPDNFNSRTCDWFTYITHRNGISPEKRFLGKAKIIKHDPTNKTRAFELAMNERRFFGLFYIDKNVPQYETILRKNIKSGQQESKKDLFDPFLI